MYSIPLGRRLCISAAERDRGSRRGRSRRPGSARRGRTASAAFRCGGRRRPMIWWAWPCSWRAHSGWPVRIRRSARPAGRADPGDYASSDVVFGDVADAGPAIAMDADLAALDVETHRRREPCFGKVTRTQDGVVPLARHQTLFGRTLSDRQRHVVGNGLAVRHVNESPDAGLLGSIQQRLDALLVDGFNGITVLPGFDGGHGADDAIDAFQGSIDAVPVLEIPNAHLYPERLKCPCGCGCRVSNQSDNRLAGRGQLSSHFATQ